MQAASPAKRRACCCWDRRAPGSPTCVLRLLDRGFMLVADDRVEIEDGDRASPAAPRRAAGGARPWHRAPAARAPGAAGAGRRASARIRRRLPQPARHAGLGLPLIALDPAAPRAAARVALALDCALGRVGQVAGRLRDEPSRPPSRRAGHRPVRRRQGLDPAGAGGYRFRGGGQPAADADGGAGRRAGAAARPARDRRRRAHPRLRCRRRAGRAGAVARATRRCAPNWSMPGPRRACCCAATPRRAGAIRWRRRAACSTASPPRRR